MKVTEKANNSILAWTWIYALLKHQFIDKNADSERQ